jgi:hypothetical protein
LIVFGALTFGWFLLRNWGAVIANIMVMLLLFSQLAWRGMMKKQTEFYQDKFNWYHETILKQMALLEDQNRRDFIKQTGFTSTPSKDLH